MEINQDPLRAEKNTTFARGGSSKRQEGKMTRFIFWLRSVSWVSVATVALVVAAVIFNSTVLALSAVPLALLASKE